MKRMFPLPFTFVAACTAQPPGPPPAIAMGGGADCIDLQQVAARHVLPPNAVIFEMAGATRYRAELEGSCAARRDLSAIVETVSRSGRLCRNDRIRIYDPVEAKGTGPASFPQCRVIGFTAVPTR